VRHTSAISTKLFIALALLIVAATILRSAIATRLDGFTLDEPYHITAGVSYVRDHDFRINPEHPPLVKLCVGAIISATGFQLDPLRPFADKDDERFFTEQDAYLHNDFHSLQHRARIAMWIFNGSLLLFLAFALRATFGAELALGTLLFLAIDPTVAAHLPVVMTDLPVALLGTTAVVLAIPAFSRWTWPAIFACSIALGLALATKHSAPIFLLIIAGIGVVRAFTTPHVQEHDSRLLRLAKLAALVACALTILWAAYFFRFAESRAPQEVFNRPLAEKISDVYSPAYRLVLRAMAATRIVPRAYTWGFADTIRAGLQGRADPIVAFGRIYFNKGPLYFFPGIIAVKLPIGLGILVLLGLFSFFARRAPLDENAGLGIICSAAALFLLVLAAGSPYGGIRHALPVVVLLSIFGGLAMQAALSSYSTKLLRALVILALAAAAASALPALRPWEYFNEIIGTKSAYLYFNDEGVDLGQRGYEIAAYYHRVVQPAGEIPDIGYEMNTPEMKALRLDWIGQDKNRDESREKIAGFSGYVLVDAKFLPPLPFWDNACLRAAVPVARFGNLMVYHGTFSAYNFASDFYFAGVSKVYSDKPDLKLAAERFRISIAQDPTAYFVYIELGNVLLKLGDRQGALEAYTGASQHALDSNERNLIDVQIKRVSSEPLAQIPDLRDPFLE
jgi:tetratricopeptide (TPR) repeat protein